MLREVLYQVIETEDTITNRQTRLEDVQLSIREEFNRISAEREEGKKELERIKEEFKKAQEEFKKAEEKMEKGQEELTKAQEEWNRKDEEWKRLYSKQLEGELNQSELKEMYDKREKLKSAADSGISALKERMFNRFAQQCTHDNVAVSKPKQVRHKL